MRRYAVTAAAATLFILAAIGWLSEVPPFECAYRAAAGAAVAFVLVRWAGSLVLSILVDAAVSRRQEPPDKVQR